jgi:amino acid permease
VEESRTIKPYQKAFTWGAIWLVISTLLLSVIYHNFSAEGFGRMFALTMISSAVVGFLAKRSKSAWSFTKVGVVYFFVAIIVFLISSYGAMKRP